MLPASIVCTNTSKSESNVRSKTVIATLGDRSVVRSTDKVMNPASFAARLKTAVPAKIEGHQLFTVACKIYHMKLFERHRYFDWIWKNFICNVNSLRSYLKVRLRFAALVPQLLTSRLRVAIFSWAITMTPSSHAFRLVLMIAPLTIVLETNSLLARSGWDAICRQLQTTTSPFLAFALAITFAL